MKESQTWEVGWELPAQAKWECLVIRHHSEKPPDLPHFSPFADMSLHCMVLEGVDTLIYMS